MVGNLIYSILLGMSVADVSGKAIANLEVESLRHVAPTFLTETPSTAKPTVLDKKESESELIAASSPWRRAVTNRTAPWSCVFRRRR